MSVVFKLKIPEEVPKKVPHAFNWHNSTSL
jgi:hypothetical protein